MRVTMLVLAFSFVLLFPSPARSEPQSAPAPTVKSRLERAYRLRAANRNDEAVVAVVAFVGYALQAIKRYDAAGAEFTVAAKEPGEFQDQAKKALEVLKSAAAEASAAAAAERQRLLDDGYPARRRGDRTAARRKFEAAVKADPKTRRRRRSSAS